MKKYIHLLMAMYLLLFIEVSCTPGKQKKMAWEMGSFVKVDEVNPVLEPDILTSTQKWH